jgi:hypothetical protein
MSDCLDKKYRAYQIRPHAGESPTSRKWTPQCLISWVENGKPHNKTLYDPHECETFPQAINYALQTAMNWIDKKMAAAEKKSA